MRKSGFYRHRNGDERLWFDPEDIEVMMEEELRKAKLHPTLDNPVVDIERLIDRHLKSHLDQFGELEEGVLGLTEFTPGEPPRIAINRDLTGAIDQDDTPAGLRGRWRATLSSRGQPRHYAPHTVRGGGRAAGTVRPGEGGESASATQV